MDENVGAAGVRLNEPKTLRRIEPFHCAGRHGALLSNRPTNLAEPLFIARRSLARSGPALSSHPERSRGSDNDATMTSRRGISGRLGPNHEKPFCNEHIRTRPTLTEAWGKRGQTELNMGGRWSITANMRLRQYVIAI